MVEFASLVGQTLTGIEGMEAGSDVVTLRCQSGRRYQMFHYQDCCESVRLEDVVGNVDDLIGSMILKAEESTSNEEMEGHKSYESFTWTFYTLATIKGYVTLRWLGENGYYSESVDFVEVM